MDEPTPKLNYADPKAESAPRKRPGELPPWVLRIVLAAGAMIIIWLIAYRFAQIVHMPYDSPSKIRLLTLTHHGAMDSSTIAKPRLD